MKNQIPKNWRKVRLGEVTTIKSGEFLSRAKRKEVGIYPVYGANGIIGFTDQCSFEEPVIVVGRVGAFGKVYLTKSKCWVSDNALVVRNNENSNFRFLYYLLRRFNFWSIVTGSTQPLITQSALANSETYIPKDINEQKRIAAVLSAFDDKIELNNKINQALEKTAQAIFKEWFVKFKIENEKLKIKNGIPKEWKMKKLGEVLNALESGLRPAGGVERYKSGIPNIGAENIIGLGRYNFSKTKYVPEEFFQSMNRGVIKDQDVLLYKDGAQVGRKSFFMRGFPFKECCVNEHVFILRSNNEISQPYLYLWLDQRRVTEMIKNLGVTSAQPGLNQNKLKNGIVVLVPTKEVMDRFNKLITPIFEKFFQNALENVELASLRDFLLPKLMSGEVRV